MYDKYTKLGNIIMHDFSLIKQLNTVDVKQPCGLAEGIVYQQYELKIEGGLVTVNIPLRESEHFETALSKHDSEITRQSLKLLLREFRGIRER